LPSENRDSQFKKWTNYKNASKNETQLSIHNQWIGFF